MRTDRLKAGQGACIIKAVEALSGVEPDSWRAALFTAYSLIANAPGADAVGNVQGIHIITNNIIFFFGIFTFAIVLGIITSTIQEQVDYLLQATHRVVEKDHTVILNWSERMIPVLRQIAMTRHYRALPVVIMADKDVDEMRKVVQEGLEGLRLPVEIRSGEPSFVAEMEKVSIGYASHVLILNPEDMGQVTFKAQCVCASVLQQRCQPRKLRGFGSQQLHTVVVQSAPSDLPEMLGFTAVRRSQMVDRALAGAVRSVVPPLAHAVAPLHWCCRALRAPTCRLPPASLIAISVLVMSEASPLPTIFTPTDACGGDEAICGIEGHASRAPLPLCFAFLRVSESPASLKCLPIFSPPATGHK